MFILITFLTLMLTALALLVIRIPRPTFRFFWLIAVGGALAAWISTWAWLLSVPFSLDLPRWQPANLFADSLTFLADGISWPLALSLTTLSLAVLLTEVARADLTNPLPWAGTLTLTALGVLAVTANDPITLVLLWAALDMAELVALLRAVHGPAASEQVVIGFSTRAVAIGLALWANVLSVAGGGRLDFRSMAPVPGLYLLVAAGLRLGILPLHLPFASESSLRRGVGTAMRLVSAASSIILLARIPPASLASPVTPLLFVFTAFAVVYTGWTWLRAPDDLSGRPFWVIGMAALAMASTLRANPVGSAAWGAALVLAGGALFMATVQLTWLNRALLLAAFGLSALPFSLSASGWESGSAGFLPAWPFMLAGHALLLAGFVRHSLRRGSRENLEAQPMWARNVYPAGIVLLLITTLGLGLFGWDGASDFGVWIAAVASLALAVILIWLTPRLRILNPIRAHWVRAPGIAWLNGLFRSLWNLYQSLGRLSNAISTALEGEGGIMWTLLFLALFISFMMKGSP